MTFISATVVDLLEAGLGRASSARTGAAFFHKLKPYGATAIFARTFKRPGDAASEEQVYCRISPPGWEQIYDERRFATVEYIPREARRRAASFAWSDMLPRTADERDLMLTLRDCGFPNGLVTPCHGPGGYLGVVSLAFERLEDLAAADRNAIEVASTVLHERMRELARTSAEPPPTLTARELDCIRFIADGYSDREIGDRLSISDQTVVSYVKSARLKLGARTRAQAVARCFLCGLL